MIFTTHLAKHLKTDCVDLLETDIDEVVVAVNEASQAYLWNDASPLWLRPQNRDVNIFRNDIYTQVVGYTLVEKDGIISTDMFSTYRDGTQIGESAMIVIGSKIDEYELIKNNDVRDDQIIRDVADCIKAGRTPVVLTKYVDHARKLSERFKAYADRVILLTGANGKKARRAQVDELNKVDDSDSLILVGTGSLLGEDFDFPRLDTLFMATPVSGENVVEQYVGRLNRDYDGKENVIVYDYVDRHISKFDKMYAARLKAYKKIGYELCVNKDGKKQEANAIYDIENYAKIYWRDLEEAKSAVIVSSPRLNNQKVNRMITVLGKRCELGVKVTIVTWHPDTYKYGRDDTRMELMERLRKAGFEIRLVEESCEHYAVSDHEIVWYGSMNLLSKEDVEDNLMRVCSKDIAAELLEMTFGSETDMQE